MVTETRQMPTPEEAWKILDGIDAANAARDEAVMQGIEEGADGRPVSKEEWAAIQLIVAYQKDAAPGFDELDAKAATRLASSLASDPLLTKVLGAWHLEGMAFDWPDNPNGILGRAIDNAVEILSTYRKEDSE